MADRDSVPPQPLHPDVNPEAWMGFESRMQARRFDALIAAAQEALSSGELARAQHALNEAREIRSTAPEFVRLSADVESGSSATRPARFVRRAATGCALLLLGSGMLVGVDILRAPRQATEPATHSLPTPEAGRAVPLQGQPFAAPTNPPFIAPVEDREPLSANSDVVIAKAQPVMRSESLGPPAVAESPVQTAARQSGVLSPPANTRAETIAPTTVAITPSSPLAELDTNMPGASVAALLSDAAARVAASSDSSGAAAELLKVATIRRGYAEAYGALDVTATRRLWPEANERELSRAFETSLSRNISFDECDINVHGTSARAYCRGQASYVADPGVPARSTGPRTWLFELRRSGDAWTIENAESTR